MKTLDEVLEAMTNEICLNSKADCWEVPVDLYGVILHYLHEYQRDKQIFAYDIAKRNMELSECNDPLTWDELKLLEGKPMWIEEIGQKYSSPHWVIHNGIEDAYDGDEILYLQPFFETVTKNSLGMTWNAYRKERINDVSRNND